MKRRAVRGSEGRVRRWARVSLAAGVVCAAGAVGAVATEAVTASGAAAASSCGGNLGNAGAFNEFSIGNATRSNSDVGGRAAYGGTLNVTSFQFGQQLSTIDATRKDLIVGNNLVVGGGGGQVQKGSATYGGTLSGPGTLGHPNGTLTNAAPPFSFATEGTNLVAESSAIAALPANGTFATAGVGFVVGTLTGTDATQNVFSLTAAQLSGVNELDIKVPAGSTTLINVSGNYDVGTKPLNTIKLWNGSSFETDSGSPSANFVLVRARLLFNFSSATAVTIATNMAFEGSVLAPLATLTVGQGQTNGAVIGSVVNGTGQTNFVLFDPNGCLPPLDTPVTPEVPFAVVLPLGALAVGGAFVVVRRRRAAPAPA